MSFLQDLRRPLFRPGVPMRLRLLGRLNRVFDKAPYESLALRIEAPEGLKWRIADGWLHVWRPGSPDLALPLEGRRIIDIRDQLQSLGVLVSYYAEDPAILTLGAEALIPGQGDQAESNGDHIYAHTSPLWAWTGAVGRWLDEARRDIPEALKQMVVPTSEAEWSDYWGSFFNVRRRPGEADSHLNMRTAYEWRRPRSNRFAIQNNIKVLHGRDVTVREPWRQMFTLNESALSDDFHLPNATEFCYHWAQLRSKKFEEWAPLMVEAEADRPAGTLFLAPVTAGEAQHLSFDSTPVIDFGGTDTGSWSIKDYDGQILSFNCALSDTYVLLNPVIGIFELRSTLIVNDQDPGEWVPPITISIGEIALDESPPMGDLQAHLAGGRRRIETGDPMTLSGDEALDDYDWNLTWGPIDRWLEASLALSWPGQWNFPAQRLDGITETRAGALQTDVVVAGDADGANSTEAANSLDPANDDGNTPTTSRFISGARQVSLGLLLPPVYGRTWQGRWDKRTWRASGYSEPVIGMAVSTETLTSDFQATLQTRRLTTATLDTRTLLAASLGRSATVSADLTTAVPLSATLTALRSVTARMRENFVAKLEGHRIVSAELTTRPRLAATLAARRDVVAELDTKVRLAAAFSRTASVAPNLKTGIKLAAALSARRTLAASSLGADWSTTNRTWLLEADATARNTVTNGAYAQLTDISGNGRRVSQGTASLRPPQVLANGRAFMDFNTTRRTLEFDLTSRDEFEVIGGVATFHVVWRSPSALWTNPIPILGAYDDASVVPSGMMALETSSNSRAMFDQKMRNDGGNFKSMSSPITWATSRVYLLTWRRNADGTTDFFRDGVKLGRAQTAATPAGQTMTASGAQLGTKWPVGEFVVGVGGMVGAAMRYGVAQTDAQIATQAAVKASRYPP